MVCFFKEKAKFDLQNSLTHIFLYLNFRQFAALQPYFVDERLNFIVICLLVGIHLFQAVNNRWLYPC